MKLSKKFLNDYLEISKKDFHDIAEKMVFLGNEYEQVKPLSPAKGLIVGEVLACEKHPESKKLSICKVDTGSETLQIVCGAPNVVAKQKVIVAPVGSELNENFKIKKVKLAGYSSEGMICSLAELGFDKKYLSPKDYEEIYVLPQTAKLGQDALTYLELDDQVIEFDLTTNRGDLLSMLGMAYEIGSLYNLPVQYPETEYQENKTKIEDNYSLDIKTENCPLYLAKLVEKVQIAESPRYIKNRLIASGIRPINNVVDISNYVMLETGQPIHFFDADKIKKLGVRMGKGEEFQTLDGLLREVNQDDIIITNNDQPIALAGVMGGLETEVTKDTKNVIIESAIFDPIKVRRTSKKTLRSEASLRFEKGIAKERTFLAIKRACYLLNKYAQGEVAQGMLKHDKLEIVDKTINLAVENVNKLLGITLKKEEITDVFDRLKLPYKKVSDKNYDFSILIPERRKDLNIEQDLIEEIGRVYDFNNIQGVLPIAPIKIGQREPKLTYIKKIRNFLADNLNETINYSLVSKEDIALFSNNKKAIKIKDPVSNERAFMRTNLMVSLYNTYNYNHARNIKDISIFEIGTVYYEKEEYLTDYHLAFLLNGKIIDSSWQNKNITVDFFVAKGMVENLLNYLGFSGRYQFKKSSKNNFHPGRFAKIFIDKKEVGYIGQISPRLVTDVYGVELNLDLLYELPVRAIKAKEPFKYPAIKKDVAFIVKNEITAQELTDLIRKKSNQILQEITIFDVYQIDDNKKSIGISLLFRDGSRTLNDQEVMALFNQIIENVKQKLDAEIRDQ